MSVWIGYKQEGLAVQEKDVCYYDIRKYPFNIFGLWNPQIDFHRMPDEVAKKTSEAVSPTINRQQEGEYVFVQILHMWQFALSMHHIIWGYREYPDKDR